MLFCAMEKKRKEEAGVEGLLPREPNGDSIQKTGDVLLVVMT